MPWSSVEKLSMVKLIFVFISHVRDLPMWPSGQRSRPACAVERNAIRGRGSHFSPGRVRQTKIYF